MTPTTPKPDPALLKSLGKAADDIRGFLKKADREVREASADNLRATLLKKFPAASDVFEDVYIHKDTVRGLDLLQGRVPAMVLRRIGEFGCAVFRTDHPRKRWIATTASLPSMTFCLCVESELASVHVYPLDKVESEDLCRLQ